jgi:hypothetical protein
MKMCLDRAVILHPANFSQCEHSARFHPANMAMRTQAFFGKKRLADFQIFRGPIDRCAIGL